MAIDRVRNVTLCGASQEKWTKMTTRPKPTILNEHYCSLFTTEDINNLPDPEPSPYPAMPDIQVKLLKNSTHENHLVQTTDPPRKKNCKQGHSYVQNNECPFGLHTNWGNVDSHQPTCQPEDNPTSSSYLTRGPTHAYTHSSHQPSWLWNRIPDAVSSQHSKQQLRYG